MTPDKVKEINTNIYKKNYNRENFNQKRVHYRGTRVPKEVIALYQRAEKGDIFKSSTFMAVTSTRKKAEEFMSHGNNYREVPLLIKITGFSSQGISSSLGVSSEKESIYSTHATFRLVNFDPDESLLTLEETKHSDTKKFDLY